MINIEELKFDEKGLIPAIVVDSVSKKVLTLAYMNEESLKITMEKKLTCFFSRSRNELWLKGETSGNYQHVVSITADCDNDALVVSVEPDGPAYHTGTESCFTKPVYENPELKDFSLDALVKLIEGRKIRTIFLIVNKIRLNTINNLKVPTAFSNSLYLCGGRGIRLHNTVVGNGNSLMTPIICLPYNIGT